VSLASDSAAQLGIYAQLAVGFAGFAGVIGSFSRFRIHAEATAFRVRAMVTLALMEAIFSLLPMLVAGFGTSDTATWRISAGFLALAGTAAAVVMARQASRLYRAGRLIRWAAYLLCGTCAVLVAPLYVTAAGVGSAQTQAFYFAFMFFGMVVCAYHFIMLMVAVQLDPAEEVTASDPAPPSSGAGARGARRGSPSKG
jgi:hypothetical protein